MNEELTFSSWLRQRRKELSITQEAFAEQLGISWITLRKLESGERNPSGQIALLLAEQLKVPSDEREAFVAFARTGRGVSGAASPTAPWRSVLLGRTNLPTPLTPLIGREEVEATILDQLLNPRTRLLTLVGAPGIGKTRLGLQVAFALLPNFEDGVYFVDLSPVAEPDLVLPAIARTLDLNETARQPLESVLLDYLRQRRTLLLLDNFEQVLDASTEVVKLMEASPWLKVLVTSREALQVRGERRFVVPPLALPDLNHLPEPGELARYPSVELFIERAQAIAPDFGLDAANAQDVAAVCAGLEGLPLAIELAASRSNLLSPAEMRAALATRLDLLRAETRDLPARQRTLRGAIQWSYNLLDRRAQGLFRSLGVFAGGFTPEAIGAMRSAGGIAIDEEGGEGERAPILDTLHALVARSLVRQDEPPGARGTGPATAAGMSADKGFPPGGRQLRGSGSPPGMNAKPELRQQEPAKRSPVDVAVRFRMWEAIREFAAEELRERGEQTKAEKAHAHYYAGLAHQAAPHLVGPEQLAWLHRLEQEHDNLRAALRWTYETSEKPFAGSMNGEIDEQLEAVEIGLRLAIDLQMYWVTRSYFSEGREVLEQLLPLAERLDCSRELRAKALARWGELAHLQGDTSAARPALEQALAWGRELGDRQLVSSTILILGRVAQRLEYIDFAQQSYEEALALARELGDKRTIAEALSRLGHLARYQGDYALARSLAEESLALRIELGDKLAIAGALRDLGVVHYSLGDYASARALHDQSLVLNQEIGDRRSIATSFTNLGLVAIMQGDLDAALNYHEQTLAIRRELGDKSFIYEALKNLGLTHSARRDFATAHSLYSENLAISRELNFRWGSVWAQYHLANVSFMQDDFAGAHALFAQSFDLRQEQDLGRTGLTIGGMAGLGAVAAAVGDAERGVRLLAAVGALSAALSALPDMEDILVSERGLSLARARLSQDAYERAWAEGQAMTWEEAIAYAEQNSP